MDDQWGVDFFSRVGGDGGGGKIVELHEVKHVAFYGCVEGVSGEGDMSDGIAVDPRSAGWRVGDRVGDQAHVGGGVGEIGR